MEKIEEAIQTACDLFVEKAEGIAAQGQVYTWLHTTAHRLLNREDEHRLRELPFDPSHEKLREVAAEDPGPAEETIAQEDEAELETLVREVSASLPERSAKSSRSTAPATNARRSLPGSASPSGWLSAISWRSWMRPGP